MALNLAKGDAIEPLIVAFPGRELSRARPRRYRRSAHSAKTIRGSFRRAGRPVCRGVPRGLAPAGRYTKARNDRSTYRAVGARRQTPRAGSRP